MLRTLALTRSFGPVTALDDVSFDVPPGHLTGFVGGNGAGKTTTMRIVTGVLAADSGQVLWQDAPITTATRRRVGYMPEERGLYPRQQVLDQLVYLAVLRGVARAAATARATALLERLGLGGRLHDRVETLSLGNQQRVQVVAALVHDPVLLVLDEPFSGLDPEAVQVMADLLAEVAARGVPVLFSSHQLDLVERLCGRLVVLDAGRVVATGTTRELREAGPVRYRLVTDADVGWVRSVRGVRVVDVHGTEALVEPVEDGAEQGVLREAVDRGAVRTFAREVPTLAEVYREVVR